MEQYATEEQQVEAIKKVLERKRACHCYRCGTGLRWIMGMALLQRNADRCPGTGVHKL